MSLPPESNKTQQKLEELYLRADISNNRTENPIMLNEFTQAILQLINEARIKEQVYVLQQIAEHALYTADQALDRMKELKK